MKLNSLVVIALIVALGVFCLHKTSLAAEIQLPQVIRPGELFVATLAPDLQTDKLIRIKIDAAHLQFMGPLQGTPDIQIISDAEFEIKPESGTLAGQYGLKFIPLLSSGSAVISYNDSRGEHRVALVLTPIGASRGYSWIILGAGLLLLIVGVKLWRYQKSSPDMMSTKSLFMNYEELEKARKMYFPEESAGGSGSAAPPPTAVPPVTPEEDKTPSVTAKLMSGGSTGKQKSVTPVNINARLAQYGVSEEKPVTPPPPASLPAAGGESTVPVVHSVSPATEDTVPAAPASDPSDETDPAKTRPAHQSVKVAAAEPPRAKMGMQAAEGEMRKDTGQGVVRMKMVFAIEDEKGWPYEAESEVIKIGRRKDCQIVLTASEISREHVEIFLDKGRMMVKPLTTSNTCRLNGNELKKPAQIGPGDKLNMGGTEFLVTKARPA